MWNRKKQLRAAARSPEDAHDQGEVSAAAVAMLARRDFSSGEITAKLRAQGYAASAVHSVVSDLLEQRFIDDARYATHRVAYQAARGQGPLRIRRDLAELDLDSALIEDALGGWDWARQARDVRLRKFGVDRPDDWRERARQARFLQYRGFSADHIRSALGDTDLDPELDPTT